MRLYITVGVTFRMERLSSHVEVIAAWGYIVHVRRDEADDAVQMIGHDDEASNTTSSRIASDRFHSSTTIFPHPVKIIRPFRTTPEGHRRPWVRPSEHFLASLRAQIVRGEGPVVEGSVTRVRTFGHRGRASS